MLLTDNKWNRTVFFLLFKGHSIHIVRYTLGKQLHSAHTHCLLQADTQFGRLREAIFSYFKWFHAHCCNVTAASIAGHFITMAKCKNFPRGNKLNITSNNFPYTGQ